MLALETCDEARLAEFGDLPRYMAQLYAIRKNKSQTINELERTGFPHLSLLRSQVLSKSEAATLKQGLMSYAERLDGAYVPRALWTLGFFFDPALIGFLQKQLHAHLARGPASADALGQCIISLDTLGEGILSSDSFDATDYRTNRQLAESYIADLTFDR